MSSNFVFYGMLQRVLRASVLVWALDFRSIEPHINDIKQESNHLSVTSHNHEELGTDL